MIQLHKHELLKIKEQIQEVLDELEMTDEVSYATEKELEEVVKFIDGKTSV